MSSPTTTPKSSVSLNPRKCPRCPHRLSDFANHVDPSEEDESIPAAPTAEVPASTAILEPAPLLSYTGAESTLQSHKTNKSYEKDKEIPGVKQMPERIEVQSLPDEVSMERLSIHENLPAYVDEGIEGSEDLKGGGKFEDAKETREDEEAKSEDVKNAESEGESSHEKETIERRSDGVVITVREVEAEGRQ